MAGNFEGGKKAAVTNVSKYGSDFYHNIGKIGGSKKVPKGFAKNLKLASEAGSIGGKKRWANK